jgi:hypothetical protein
MEAMTKAIDPDLSAAIAPAAAGDDLAFGRIVAAHHNEMCSICVVMRRDRPLAEEHRPTSAIPGILKPWRR